MLWPRLALWLVAGILLAAPARAHSEEVTFDFTGAEQTWLVPAAVTSITVDVAGAQGGGGLEGIATEFGGNGGRVQTTLPVTPGETLYIYVGGYGGDLVAPNTPGAGGFNGGGPGGIDDVDGNGPAGGGGGASDIRRGGRSPNDRVVVAGGGGGAEGFQDGPGGAGGGPTAGSPGGSSGYSTPGEGGSETTAGNGGSAGGTAGTFGQGGTGGNGNRAGGGGGGGWYGGGGGGGGFLGSGGGGGSSYSGGTNTIHTQGYQAGAGRVVITYTCDTSFRFPTSQSGSWSDGIQLLLDDDADAVGSVGQAHQVRNYGFSIPSGVTITGIAVTSEGSVGDETYGHDIVTDLSSNGGASFTAQSRGCGCRTPRITWTNGGAGDTWGRTWASSDFSDANFRLRLRCLTIDPTSTPCRADYASVRVFHSCQAADAPRVTLLNPLVGANLFITDEPAMPVLNASATIVNYANPQLARYNWVFEATFPVCLDTNCVTTRTDRIRRVERTIGGQWTPAFGDEFGGGSVLLTVEAANTQASNSMVNIYGNNPMSSAVKSSLTTPDASFTPFFSQVIAYKETNVTRGGRVQTWHQFDTSTGPNDSSGLPLQSSDRIGYGIMQLSRPSPRRNELWNWRSSIAAGLDVIQTKYNAARKHLNQHRPYTTEMLQLETWQRYNGGAYWKWDKPSRRWIVHPDWAHNYADNAAAIASALPASPPPNWQ